MTHLKSLFIGGAFSDSQYLWILPIIFSYVRENKINQIILENSLSNKVSSNLLIKKNLSTTNIVYLKKNKIFLILQFFFFDFFDFLKKKNNFWFKYQIYHSFIDTSRILSKNDKYKIPIINSIKAALKIIIQYSITKSLINNYNLESVFLGHTVYQYRVSLALMRNYNFKIYCHANNSLYKIERLIDNRWDFINEIQNRQIDKLINRSKVEIYWSNRKKGKSNYEDYNSSYKKNKKFPSPEKTNVVMLHVFRDSPFNFIDKNKIFIDYYDWILGTIKILNKSEERWYLKIHPSAKRWGENSINVINDLLNSHKIKLKTNIVIDNDLSNSFFFENLNKLITFSGTSGIESMAYGIKPITISQITHSKSIVNDCYIQPKNIKNYEELILSKDLNIFKIKDKNLLYECKKLIFIKENVITLNNDFESRYIYRGDNITFVNDQFKILESDIKNNEKFLNDIGKKLRSNENFFSKKYFYINENFRNN